VTPAGPVVAKKASAHARVDATAEPSAPFSTFSFAAMY